jgi:catechol 2,3-dioxygenase-like lactoylglutathione lyase family enzyme
VAASIEHYVETLGFKLQWRDERSGFACVSRGRCHLFLCEGDQGHFGTWVWIGAADVEKTFLEYQDHGARIRHPPTNYPWALEMQVEDLDGNVLRIGSEPKDNEPWGEWLDMYGDRWLMSPQGEWQPSAVRLNKTI